MTDTWTRVASTLREAGCDTVFGLPTDDPGLLDVACREPGLAGVRVRDHRIGAYAAAGFSSVARRPAALAVASGPAFAGAVPGLVEAASIGLPLVVVTTRVGTDHRGRGAFQELDQAAFARPLVKWQFTVEDPDQVVWATRQAVRRSVSGRPGLTMLEFSSEVLAATDARDLRERPETVLPPLCVPSESGLHRAVEVLEAARRPLVLAGGGARWADAGQALRRLLDVYPAAFATTASGRGVLSEADPRSCGVVGLYATPPLDAVLDDVDVVLAVGTRLEETACTGWAGLRQAKLIHIDADESSFGLSVEPTVSLLGDAAETCEALADRLAGSERARSDGSWSDRVARARAEAEEAARPRSFDATPVRAALQHFRDSLGDDLVIAQENGLHDLWGYHFPMLSAGSGTTFVVPGEQTTMGYGVGAAIGAAVATPERTILAICGDGALELSIPALSTLAELRAKAVILVLDNAGFGWPRMLRRAVGAPTGATDTGAVPLPFLEVARGLGLGAASVTGEEDLGSVVGVVRDSLEQRRPIVVRVETSDADIPYAAQRAVAP